MLSSVSLVIVNKYLISTLMVPSGTRWRARARACGRALMRAPARRAAVTTLTAAHMFITAGALDGGAKCLRLFETKGLEWKCVRARRRGAARVRDPHTG